MPKRISKSKKKPKKKKREPESDVNQLAHRLVLESTEPELTKEQISKFMAEMGRKGGKIGGKRRLVTMTPEQRSGLALRAAQTRWAKRNKKAS